MGEAAVMNKRKAAYRKMREMMAVKANKKTIILTIIEDFGFTRGFVMTYLDDYKYDDSVEA